jgi:hypothetical protein
VDGQTWLHGAFIIHFLFALGRVICDRTPRAVTKKDHMEKDAETTVLNSRLYKMREVLVDRLVPEGWDKLDSATKKAWTNRAHAALRKWHGIPEEP